MNSPEKLNKALELVKERSSVLIAALELQQGEDGETYGQTAATGAELVAHYLWLGDHTVELQPIDPENPDVSPMGMLVQRLLPGYVIQPNMPPPPPLVVEHVDTLAHLEVVSPKYYAKLTRDYLREVARQAERVA